MRLDPSAFPTSLQDLPDRSPAPHIGRSQRRPHRLLGARLL